MSKQKQTAAQRKRAAEMARNEAERLGREMGEAFAAKVEAAQAARRDRVEHTSYVAGDADGEWSVLVRGYGADSLAATLSAARGLSLGVPS